MGLPVGKGSALSLTAIRSERRLCKEVHLNLAYRWFCRLDLSDRVPDHSAFSKNPEFFSSLLTVLPPERCP